MMARTVQRRFLFAEPEIKDWIHQRILWLASIYYATPHAVTVRDNHTHIVFPVSKPERDCNERLAIKIVTKHWYETVFQGTRLVIETTLLYFIKLCFIISVLTHRSNLSLFLSSILPS